MNIIISTCGILVLRENMDVVPILDDVQRGRAYFRLRAPVVGRLDAQPPVASSSIPFDKVARQRRPGHEERPQAAAELERVARAPALLGRIIFAAAAARIRHRGSAAAVRSGAGRECMYAMTQRAAILGSSAAFVPIFI